MPVSNQDECAICMDPLLGGERMGVCTPCGHVFHVRCFGDYRQSLPQGSSVCRCPVCTKRSRGLVPIFLETSHLVPPARLSDMQSDLAAALNALEKSRSLEETAREKIQQLEARVTMPTPLPPPPATHARKRRIVSRARSRPGLSMENFGLKLTNIRLQTACHAQEAQIQSQEQALQQCRWQLAALQNDQKQERLWQNARHSEWEKKAQELHQVCQTLTGLRDSLSTLRNETESSPSLDYRHVTMTLNDIETNLRTLVETYHLEADDGDIAAVHHGDPALIATLQFYSQEVRREHQTMTDLVHGRRSQEMQELKQKFLRLYMNPVDETKTIPTLVEAAVATDASVPTQSKTVDAHDTSTKQDCS